MNAPDKDKVSLAYLEDDINLENLKELCMEKSSKTSEKRILSFKSQKFNA